MAVPVRCSSDYNTVRLRQTEERDILTLRTQHYLQTDHNHVQELDRGERRAEIRGTLRKNKAGSSELSINIALKLYHDDPTPALACRLENANNGITLQLSPWNASDLQEKVTVLDTGQRTGPNGALTSEVQAQTGYITFGKPTAAGSVQRLWRIHNGEVTEPEKFISNLIAHTQISLSLGLGTTPARIEFKPEQLRAWQRFARGEIDKVIDKGD